MHDESLDVHGQRRVSVQPLISRRARLDEASALFEEVLRDKTIVKAALLLYPT